MEKFDLTNRAVHLNLELLEELTRLDYRIIDTDEKAFLFSQLEKSIGKIISIIKKHE